MTTLPEEEAATTGLSVMVLGSYGPSLINFRGPLIAAMTARGWTVTAVSPGIDDRTAEALRALGAEPVDIDLARTGMNPLADLGYFRRLKALMRDRKPDALVAYTAKPVIWSALAARSAGVRAVVLLITGLGLAFTDGAGSPVKRTIARLAAAFLYRRALPVADKVLFQNPDDRDLFLQHGLLPASDRIGLTSGSGVDLNQFTPEPVPAKPAFLMVARLLGAKGVREYAAAALRLRARWPGVPFRLAGYIDPGPDSVRQEELDGWIAQGVEYLGPLEDVRPALADCSVYVLPSWREGTPRSVLEAMATGRAVVTTDAPGCRETVEDGRNGFLVPLRDPERLAEAMERFLVEPGLATRMGAESLALAREKFDVHKVNAVIIAAIEGAIAGDHGARGPGRLQPSHTPD